MASLPFKKRVIKLVGQRSYDGLYRLFYNFVAAVTFIPVFYFGISLLPNQELWRLPNPINLLFLATQVGALIGLVISLLYTDLLRFAGIGQFIRFLRGEQIINPAPQFRFSGPYRIVRHPLYFFSLVLLWFVPVMTLSILVINLVLSLYFWIGSIIEEQRLQVVFGDSYREYQQRVPRLFPLKFNSNQR
jgi:protein-S-isoprenylcysteine O-methyltransferase Ste14